MLICGTIVRYVISNQLIAFSPVSLNSYLRDEIGLKAKRKISCMEMGYLIPKQTFFKHLYIFS